MLASILSRYANFAVPGNVTYGTHSSSACSFVHCYGKKEDSNS